MAHKIVTGIVVVGWIITFILSGSPVAAETITAFIGSASKPPMDEINALFSRKHGIEVAAQYGGSGEILSQMKMSGKGDIYLPGSPDFMDSAQKEGLIDPATIRIIAYLIPAINVQRGNPKNIQTLKDLARKDVELVIANPKTVCVGLYAVEVFEATTLSSLMKPKIKSYAESCARTANIIALGGADAVMGWEVFEHWNPDRIQTILLKPEEIPRISYIPIAVSTLSQQKDVAANYLAFVTSPEGTQIFKKWGYLTDEAAARKYAPHARIGGTYVLPVGW
jgi:molybdate transport system substrate-binding protein